MYGVGIVGMGMSVPDEVVTNGGIRQMLLARRERLLASGATLTSAQMTEFETDDPWIVERTGIHERRFAPSDKTTSDYLAQAAEDAWKDAYGAGPEIPEFFEVATVSPDFVRTPSTAVCVHRKMGIPVYEGSGDNRKLRRFFSADSSQACSSFVVGAFRYAWSNIASGLCVRGIAGGGDIMSRTSNPYKRTPYVILADGGGAVALERTAREKTWIPPEALYAGVNGGHDGALERIIMVRSGGMVTPTAMHHLDPMCDDQWIVMDGRKVYTLICPLIANEVIPAASCQAGIPLQRVDVLILHQANQRITEWICRLLMESDPMISIRIATWDCPEGVPIYPKNETGPRTGCHEIICYTNIDRYGNTTSASVPMAMYEARKLGIIHDGAMVLVVGKGGGLSWGTVFIYWGGMDHPAFKKTA